MYPPLRMISKIQRLCAKASLHLGLRDKTNFVNSNSDALYRNDLTTISRLLFQNDVNSGFINKVKLSNLASLSELTVDILSAFRLDFEKNLSIISE